MMPIKQKGVKMKAYQKDIKAVEKSLETNITKGLNSEEAKRRIDIHEKYKLQITEPSILLVFLSQFKDPLIYILLIAAAIIFFLGEPLDAFIISGILFFNSIIGTIQEKRTSSILTSLRTFILTETIVVRDGIEQIVSNEHLVPGDIIILKSGEQVPADARIIEAKNVTVDEALFTGESHPIRKVEHVIHGEHVPPYEQSNIIFQGTHIISGHIKAIVTAIGTQSETGALYQTINTIETNIPLKKEVEKISWSILVGTLILCATLLIIGLLSGKAFVDLLVLLTALFICVIPEGLPLVMTLIMISGAHRMAKKNVLVTHLQSIEALGRVDTIVIDKTGTLTKNELMVQNIYVNDTVLRVTGEGYKPEGHIEQQDQHNDSIHKLSQVAHILQNAHVEFNAQNKAKIKGDPTEAAVYIFTQKTKLHHSTNYTSLATIPFSSEYKYQAKLIEQDQNKTVSVMGAPEKIFNMCTTVPQGAQKTFEDFSAQGYRTVALAQKTIDKTNIKHEDLQELEFLGMLAIQDTIRQDIHETIQKAKQDGIKIIMATGDHEKTAQYIAEQAGIYRDTDHILTSAEFQQLNDQEATQKLRQTSVCARFSPQDKLRLIDLYHKQHKIVAMTGDGINDVPSLIAADISITMGNTATDITKQASDIVLLEDSFKNILYAIEEGRSMFLALKRTILYFLTSNSGEVLIVFFALLLNLPMPMLAAQILWLNLITDGFLDVALSMEPKHPNQKRSELSNTLIDRSVLYKTIYLSLPMSLISLGVFLYYYQVDIVLARTLTLLIMAMFQWFNAWNCRSEKQSIFTIGLLSNKWLILATATVFILQFGVIYLPFMQTIFRTTSLEIHHWGIAIGLSSLILIAEEIKKYITRKK